MARRCACDRLWEQLERDVRLRTLPMAAQYLWLRLMRLALETADGVLLLGSELGFRTALAVAVSQSETEVETAFAILEARGLAIRDGDTVRMPEAADGVARGASARANGARGGRPRRGETPEQARARRAQGSLMLPVPGSLAKTQETEAETQTGETAPPTSSRESKTLTSPVSPSPARETDWVSLGQECAELAQLDPMRGYDYRPLQGWLTAGAAPELIREVIGEVVKGLRPGQRIVSFKYFDAAMQRALEAGRVARKPIPMDGVSDLSPHGQALQAWIKGGMRGPAPRREDFLARSAA